MKKKLLSLLCVVLLVVGAVFGTYAYLTDTDEAVNTFTVGKVDIELDEADVDVYGKVDSNERVKANTYKLIPGHTYVKDPTVTVKAGSEESYVRMFVTFTCSSQLDAIFPNANLISIFNGYDSDWQFVGTVENVEANTRTYEFRYANTVTTLDPEEDNVLDPIFSGFTLPGTVTKEQLATLEGFNMTVVAQAIQADGFATADLAWASF